MQTSVAMMNCGAPLLFDAGVRRLVASVAALASVCAFAQPALQHSAGPPVQEFRFTATPVGKTIYKSIDELPESARAVLKYDAPGVKTQMTKDGVAVKVYPVDDVAVLVIERERGRLLAIPDRTDVASIPDYLTRSDFRAMKSEVTSVDRTIAGGPGAHATYIFSSEKDAYLLKSWDYVTDGGSVLRIIEFCNTKVNDTPATFVILRGANGDEIRQLSWATEKRSFDLYYHGKQGMDESFTKMLVLATSLQE